HRHLRAGSGKVSHQLYDRRDVHRKHHVATAHVHSLLSCRAPAQLLGICGYLCFLSQHDPASYLTADFAWHGTACSPFVHDDLHWYDESASHLWTGYALLPTTTRKWNRIP